MPVINLEVFGAGVRGHDVLLAHEQGREGRRGAHRRWRGQRRPRKTTAPKSLEHVSPNHDDNMDRQTTGAAPSKNQRRVQ